MRAPRLRRIWVPFKLEAELWERHGKFVRLDGQTYIVKNLTISGAEPVQVELVQSAPQDGDEVKDVEHWMQR